MYRWTARMLLLAGFWLMSPPVHAQPGPNGGDKDRFKVPKGFRVEQAVRIPDTDKTFSLVNLTFDAKGRLLLSREGGPVLLCTDPDKNGVPQTVRPYCTQVTNCQGMCWVDDALLLVGNGPKGTGLYRARDTAGKDKIDEVTLLHQFQGGMGEHGPHAILHGPDDWIYVVIGNFAGARLGPDAAKNGANPAKLAGNSPITRWPTGSMGLDQGKPGTTEDVLLPRHTEPGGFAAGVLAPGGTIWRMDKNGKNVGLVAAGFRNEFDAAFSPRAELFTFDSDMEPDEGLPWYRSVRAYHCPPGSDFVWRTGMANTPDYYLDNLPTFFDAGRGSPVGLEFYDHHVFPEKYRGALFMADWSIGQIYAVGIERNGASYKPKFVEKFCTGAPLNVTDCVVGPDGALYFCMGGRGSQGGVYRIVYPGGKAEAFTNDVERILHQPQPLSAWARARTRATCLKLEKSDRGTVRREVAKLIVDGRLSDGDWIRTLDLFNFYLPEASTVLDKMLLVLPGEAVPEIRAHAIWLLGVRQMGTDQILAALKDRDALVRRRACESLIRAEVKTPIADIWPLLADPDPFVRNAARLVLIRIPLRDWASRLTDEPNELGVLNAMVVLCQHNQAGPYAEPIFTRLARAEALKTKEPKALLDVLRTLQLALIHIEARPAQVNAIAENCLALFPHTDWRVNRELAVLLCHFQREGRLKHVQAKILQELLQSKKDRLQQIHYFYCLRSLRSGWTEQERTSLWNWFDANGGGGHQRIMVSLFEEALAAYPQDERKKFLADGEKTPLSTLALASRLQTEIQPELLPDLSALAKRLAEKKVDRHGKELTEAVRDALTRTALARGGPDAWPYLVRGLATTNPLLRADTLSALRKFDKIKPKAEDAEPFRAVILAADAAAGAKERWLGIELLRQWTGRSFGAEPEQGKKELQSWANWFAQSFPKEPPLPNLAATKPAESKYKFAELLDYLEKDGRVAKASPERGRLVFEKALCSKCHKFGKEGEGIGPDLTSVSKRFKRADLLDSILFPSKVISDQFRSVTITTKSGQVLTGLAAVQGDVVTLLRSDASKITFKTSDIDSQVASLISVMPERLLDPLTLEQIADLVAYLESEPR